jgi:hypothetical protein
MSKPAPPVPLRGWAEVISDDERKELERLTGLWHPRSENAADILRCVNAGVEPPPESIEWFLLRFRGGA